MTSHSALTLAVLVAGFVAGVYSERANERRRVAAVIAESETEYASRNLRCVDEGDETVCRWRRSNK